MSLRNDPPATVEELERQMARVVCAQICKQQGFTGVKESALSTLSEVMLRYMKLLGHSAHEAAEGAGRTECNLQDVLKAFSEMGVVVKDLIDDCQEDELPFARAEPQYPIRKRHKPQAESFLRSGAEPPAHVPTFLPEFPAAHTYKATPVFEQAKVDEKEARVGLLQQRKAGEDALLGLEERLAPAATTDYLGSAIMDLTRLEALRAREQREIMESETAKLSRLLNPVAAGVADAADGAAGRIARARSENAASVAGAAAAAARLGAPISGTVVDLEGAAMDASVSVNAFANPEVNVVLVKLPTDREDASLRKKRIEDESRVMELVDRDPNDNTERGADEDADGEEGGDG